jgi:hypothetical protein
MKMLLCGAALAMLLPTAFAQTAEMKVFDNLVGKWSERIVVKPGVLVKQEITAERKAEYKWILGKTVMQSTSRGADGNSLFVASYDRESKSYLGWSTNFRDEDTHAKGRYDAEKKRMSWTHNMTKDGSLVTWSMAQVNKDRYTFDITVKNAEVVVLEIEGYMVRQGTENNEKSKTPAFP